MTPCDMTCVYAKTSLISSGVKSKSILSYNAHDFWETAVFSFRNLARLYGMSFGYSLPKDTAEMTRLIHATVDRGVTFFDTAEVYGPYINEELVGSALAPFKGKVVIATKFGFEAKPEDGRWTKLNSRPEHIRAVAEASLKRSNVDALNLFLRAITSIKKVLFERGDRAKQILYGPKILNQVATTSRGYQISDN